MAKKTRDQATDAINPQTGLKMPGHANAASGSSTKTASGTDVEEVKYWNQKSDSNKANASGNFPSSDES
jgi:hypothetical protein